MPTQDNPGEPDPVRGLTLPVSKKGAGCPCDPEVLKHATHIDRRTCKRVVPLKILVLGLSQSGTVSLRHALFELGYFDVYHGSSVCNENPRDAEMWTETLQGNLKAQSLSKERIGISYSVTAWYASPCACHTTRSVCV